MYQTCKLCGCMCIKDVVGWLCMNGMCGANYDDNMNIVEIETEATDSTIDLGVK